MWIWIVVALVVVALAAFALWPRRRGVVDGEVRRSRAKNTGKAGEHVNPGGPTFGGPSLGGPGSF